MGRKRKSADHLTGGREESSGGDTDADDAFIADGNDGEMDVIDDVPNTQPVDERVLKDVIAYVEVRTKTENRSKGVSKQLELLGAKVEKKFSNDVTHVIWKDGKKSTREKAAKKGIRLVSVLWVDSCKQNQEHVTESLFPIVAPDDKDVLQIGKLKRMKSMQPKEVEEDIQRSAGKGIRKRRARILHQTPAPLTITNPAILVAETQPMSPIHNDIPHTPSLIPDTPSSMKPCLDLLDSIKKGQGSAQRRVSITDSPNLSPSTPLCQRLFQCFTEEANSCAESPSTSVKLHKSGPVRRLNSRRKLDDGERDSDIDSPSLDAGASTRDQRRRSTATPSGRKLAEMIDAKVSTPPADSRGRGRKSMTSAGDEKIAKQKVLTPADSRRRGRKSMASAGDEKIAGEKVVTPADSRRRGRKSMASAGDEKIIAGEKVLTPADSRRRGRKSMASAGDEKIAGEKVVTPADSRRRGRKSMASAGDEKIAGEKVLTPPLEVGQSSTGRGRKKRSSSRNRKSNVSDEIKRMTEADIVVLEKSFGSGNAEVMEQNSMEKGSGRGVKSLKRKLSLDCESSLSQEQRPEDLKNCTSSNDRTALTKRKKRSSIKASNETIATIHVVSGQQDSVSETKDMIMASSSTCSSDNIRPSQEKNAIVSQDSCSTIKNKSQGLRRKKVAKSKGSNEMSSEVFVLSDTSMETLPSASESGGTRSSARRRSCLPSSPVPPVPGEGQDDQSRRRSNRRKSVAPVIQQPSLADHLRRMGLHCSVNIVPCTTTSAGSTDDTTNDASLSDAVSTEGKKERSTLQKKQEAFSSRRSQNSAFDEAGEGSANKWPNGEKENQNEQTPVALSKRTGVPEEDVGKKRKLSSHLPSQLTCSSVLSSNTQNRPSIDDFRAEGHKVKRLSQEKDSIEDLCTSSEDSTISSDDLDDVQRKENKNTSSAVNDKKSKRRKKVTLSDNLPSTRKKKSTIVMTSLHKSDQEIVLSVVKNLGRFAVTDTVCDTTTHVVVGENRRTLNVLSGIARGCWIVSMDWVYRSVEAGSWLTEEPYEMNVHFPGAMISRLAHGAQSDTDSLPTDLFSSSGALYVPPESNPPKERLVELIELCGGQISRKPSDAKLYVGSSARGKKGTTPVVNERWILDCITRFKLLPWNSYKVKSS